MPDKARAVRLTPLAEADLEDIWTYTFEQWSLEQAERYVGDLVEAFERLARGDWVGRSSRASDDYRRYLVGSHVVFYRETTTTLDVIRVLHQRMDVDRHL
ncbi:type II toxin-antitoxin system RelE/ParE family toxin [Burkholderia gladioli]|uniref:type II toxin-antitoxin system RelE/ParE family toxin n=1 Tax=Burkholderia gladioli TaxID=28095 RepID=UPI00050FBAC6|nr:type II toxin-antitoxin system RelE/ParE family toxin [Burkholderia gladioli]KGE10506.1 plasmid stabilization protein ParE [Burkholderia gladioli]MBU9170889.1 type II toxin-antitoxin system RelE/ParE family toxin [Burkholderia gladioli]MBU9193009.1 type II toxin-antitoxin system RelE/ParE family toxin [Burkholderia gladioli]MBU9217752.1 type II toxin-antitoxin system RelE/ParE family toxin [Burkholderia gladioli]MBU9384495.1 type II toxin-antitoxin system RelE/ParE family toxin [Burkholderi